MLFTSHTAVRESYTAALHPFVRCMHSALDSTVFHRNNTIPFRTDRSYDCIQKCVPFVESNLDTFDQYSPAQICLLNYPPLVDAACTRDTPGTSDLRNRTSMDCDRGHKTMSYRPDTPSCGDRRFDSSQEWRNYWVQTRMNPAYSLPLGKAHTIASKPSFRAAAWHGGVADPPQSTEKNNPHQGIAK
eukprot:scaffold362_cov176-Amphora_coffeaeformis.AAC.40